MERIGAFNQRVMSGPMTWRYAVGEVVELLVEMRDRNWEGVREEASDAVLCLQLALFHQLGGRVDWPLVIGLKAAFKFERRLPVWERLFAAEGLRFDKRYLIGGGNYNRPAKVQAAFRLAREEQYGTD